MNVPEERLSNNVELTTIKESLILINNKYCHENKLNFYQDARLIFHFFAIILVK